MMPDFDKISQYVDESALKQQTDFFLQQFSRVEAKALEVAKSFSAFNLKFEGGAGIKDSITGLQKLSTETTAYTKTVKEANVAAIQAEKLSQQLAKTKLAEAAAAEKLARQQLAETKLREANEVAAAKEEAAVRKANKAKDDLSSRPIESIPFEIKTGGENDIENLKKQGEAVSDLDKEQAAAAVEAEKFAEANKKADATTQAAAKTAIVYKDDLEKLTGTLNENIELQILYKEEMAAVSLELKELQKNTSFADKQTDEYKSKVVELTGRQNELKAQSADLTNVIKNQMAEQNNAAGSLDALRARLNLATDAYEKMGTAQKQSSIGVNLKQEIGVLITEISKQEQGLGKFQRNVGNYTKSIVAGFKTAFSGLRTLANIIPGAGISGILLGIGTAVVALAQNLFGGEDAVKKFNDSLNDLSERIDKTKDKLESLTAQAEYLKKLGDITIDINIVGGYEKTILKIQSDFVNLNELVGSFPDIVKDSMKDAADANSLFTSKLSEDLIIAVSKYSALKKIPATIVEQFSEDQKKAFDIAKQAEAAYESVLKQQDKALKDRTISGINIRLAEEEQQKKIDGERIDSIAKQSEKERKEALELSKFRINLAIEEQKRIILIGTLPQKITARKKQNELEEKLIREITLFELAEGQIQINAVEEKFKQGLISQSEYNSELLKVERIVTSERKLLLEKQTSDIDQANIKKLVDIIRYGEEERKVIAETMEAETKEIADAEEKRIQDQINRAKKLQDKRVADISIASDKLIIAENERYVKELAKAGTNQKKIEKAEERHQDEITKIQKNAIRDQLLVQLEYYRTLLKNIDLTKEEKIEAEKQFSDIERQISELDAENEKRNRENHKKKHEEKLKDLEEYLQKAQDIYGQLGDVVSGALDAITIRQKNAIQDQIDLLDKQKAKDIEIANQTITNAQDKAAAIAIIEARSQAKRDQLELKQRQADERKAKFDKAIAIASIILNTAVAVVKYLSETNYFQAIAAGILGAAELAVAIATPIPKFKVGLNKDYEGFGYVGDGRKHEVIERNDGSIEITPDTDTLTYINKGDRIHSDADEFFNTAKGTAMRGIAKTASRMNGVPNTKVSSEQSLLKGELVEVNRNLKKLIGKKELHLNASDSGLTAMWKHGANQIKYIKDQTNW
jgi:hypothetical protein